MEGFLEEVTLGLVRAFQAEGTVRAELHRLFWACQTGDEKGTTGRVQVRGDTR